jgi:mannose-6-phosphate isomerase-like protein (cupin superfamily)
MRYVAMLAALSAVALGSTQMDMQTKRQPMSPHQLKWGPAPPGLPKGARVAILQGDPGKAGLFTLRAQLPNGYKVPPHWHSTDEMVTIISGHIYMAMGDKLDVKHAKLMGPGGFMEMPAKSHHWVKAKGPVTIQVHAMGPFDINYINPKDDPRKM